MVKHRRWSDKPKSESPKQEDENSSPNEEISSTKTSIEPKTLLHTGIKYVYILVFGALLSGIFTTLTLGIKFNEVIFGMLSIFLGLGGGVLILIGLEKNKLTILFVVAGLGMIFASLILIHQIIYCINISCCNSYFIHFN